MAYQAKWGSSVVFITEPVTIGAVTQCDPVGTGFILKVNEGHGFFHYVVTAAHVVKKRHSTAVRFRDTDGGVFDLEAGEWAIHDDPKADLAACLVAGFERDKFGHRAMFFDPRVSRSPAYGSGRVGDEVHYIGLLDPIRSMKDRMVPFVRSGTIGAIGVENIPISTEGEPETVDGHLLDCRGRGGFSGSPCFMHSGEVTTSTFGRRVRGVYPKYQQLEYREREQFLGVFVGYFPEARDVSRTSGVGVVVPTIRVAELLGQEELVGERAARLEAADDEESGS